MLDTPPMDATGTRQPPRILLAVDGQTIASFAAALLRKWGYTIAARATASEAATLVGNGHFDLVIIEASAAEASLIANACMAASLPLIALRTGALTVPGVAFYAAIPFVPDAFRATVAASLACTETAEIGDGGIDPAIVTDLWGGLDNRGFLTVSAVFLVELRDRLKKIDSLLERGSHVPLELEAHSIKGAASNVGAVDIRDCAERLEAAAVQGSSDELHRLTRALHIASERGIQALEKIIASGRHR